jgi:uncharacterized membrane protein (UPF0127 family)
MRQFLRRLPEMDTQTSQPSKSQRETSNGRYEIIVERTQGMIADHASIARSWRSRMIGLLGRQTLPEGEALIFPGCSSIHTFGMQFSIDTIFVDRAWRVVAIRERVSPGRIVSPFWRAWGVIEAPAGTLKRIRLKVGDLLLLKQSQPTAIS